MTHARDHREWDESGGSERREPWSVDPERGQPPPPRRPPATPPPAPVDPPYAELPPYADLLDLPSAPPAPEHPPAYQRHPGWGAPSPDPAGSPPGPATGPPQPAFPDRPVPPVPPAAEWPPPPAVRRRHRTATGAGGGRPPRRIGWILAGALVPVLVIGAGLYFTRSTFDDSCDGSAVLQLAVAAEVSPLIERAAADTGGGCPTVRLTPLASGHTSAILTERGLDGWVPASSAWLHLMSAAPASAGASPTPGTSPSAAPGTGSPAPGTQEPGTQAGFAPVSLVRTPLVVAAPRPLAEALGWPQQQPTWAELTGAVVQGAIPRFSMDSPLRTSTGLLGVLGVHAAMSKTTPDQGIAQLRALTLRSRLANANADATGLLRQLGTLSDPDAAVRDVGAFPVTEQALGAYQNGQPAIPLAAFYPADGLLEADYPLALAPAAAADSDRLEVALRLIARFQSPEFAPAVAAHGFRPVGAAPETATPIPTPTAATQIPTTPTAGGPADAGPGSAPDAAGLLERYPAPTAVPTDPVWVVGQAHQWAEYERLAFQTLILVDASASMNDPVRDRSGDLTTKAELLRAAGIQAAELFGVDTSLGIWTFATPTPTSPPYVEVVPFGPLDEPVDGTPRRELVRGMAEGYRPYEVAGTPLYETVLRGIAAMQPLVKPETVTLVVVLTDGRDEDTPFAMGRLQFLSRLGEVQDRDRPVPVFCIGYGADADMQSLTDIAAATGGRAVASNDPGDLASAIAQLFLAAHRVR